MVASVSKLRRASTSVDTRPGTILRISVPKVTQISSRASRTTSSAGAAAPHTSRDCCRERSIRLWYVGICAAARISEGLVVASRGVNWRMAQMSPVSATTTVMAAS